MSDDAIDRAADRVQVGRAARAASAGTGTPSAGAAPPSVTDQYAPGARVFDTQRGRDGVIIRAPAGAAILGATVWVRFDQGDLSLRPTKFLLVRPEPPAARG